MNIKKILLWFTSIIVLICLGYFLLFNLIFPGILFSEPRNPKNQIETTNKVGWWANQENLIINSFTVSRVESKLNIFNSKSLISYEIEAELKGEMNWEPLINKIHISEISDWKNQKSDTIKIETIEISPIVKVEQNKKYKGLIKKVKFKNEIIVESMNWGKNEIHFKCHEFDTIIHLIQNK